MDATMSADNPLIPFALPVDAEFGSSEQSSPGFLPLGPRRHRLNATFLLFIWLLSCGFLAITALYHVIADGTGAIMLSWTASAGAVALLLGAIVLGQKSWSFTSMKLVEQTHSSLLLFAFVIPTAQLLLTMAVTQDLSYSTYVLLLAVGYSLLAPTSEAVLLYVTITLATWCACALRCPAGAWVGYVLPWAASVGMSLFIQSRIHQQQTSPKLKVKSSSSVIDVNLAEPLREALAERDRAVVAKHLAEKELADIRVNIDNRVEYLPILQHLTQQLAQDVTLQEAGPRWLEHLLAPIHADFAAIWIKERDQEVRLAVSSSATTSSDEQLLFETLQAGTILNHRNNFGVPLDLGFQGRGVLLVHGCKTEDLLATERYLRTAGSLLALFLRWQWAEVESDNITQQSQQQREQYQILQQEFITLQQTSKQIHEHFRSQYEAAQQELQALQSNSSKHNSDIQHWKAEAERFQKLVDEAQAEHDTLSQLLDEAEAELKRMKDSEVSSTQVKDLEVKLKVAEAAAESARQQMLKTEQQLKASETQRQTAEKQWNAAETQLASIQAAREQVEAEAREIHAEWERETALVERFTASFRSLSDPIALFDAGGMLLCENPTAEELRGSTRNLPGEHPLYQVISKDKLQQKKPWTVDWSHNKTPYSVSITPLLQQQKLAGYCISAVEKKTNIKPVIVEKTAPNDESALTGPRFFGGLAQTLEPPLSQLICHADTLLDAGSDQTIRRQSLLGILQQGRQVRRLLTQAVDYAQLEAGQATPIKAPVAPWQLVQQIVNQLRPAAEEKGLEVFIQPTGSIPASITTDSQRLGNLIYHLLSQTIRNTQHGNITVKLSVANNRLRIDIDGATRSPAQSFAAEFDSMLTRRQATSIAAVLEEQPSRTSILLSVTSAEMLHLLPSDRLKIDEETLPDSTWLKPLQGKALIVCDGQENQRVATYQLERLGLRCEVLEHAQQALERASEDRFDVILWDAAKRDIDLVEASQKLRAQFYQGAILAIGPTYSSDQRDNFLAVGGDAVLHRPIVLATWRHTIASYLPHSDQPPGIVNESILSEFQADRDFYPLIRSYVGKLPGQLAEMRAALQVADVARLTKMTHALADGGQLYGYPQLTDLAHKLEKVLIQGRDAPLLTSFVDQIQLTIRMIEVGISQSHSHHYLALPSPLTKAA